jgi:hypothetical protein
LQLGGATSQLLEQNISLINHVRSVRHQANKQAIDSSKYHSSKDRAIDQAIDQPIDPAKDQAINYSINGSSKQAKIQSVKTSNQRIQSIAKD